MTTSADPRRFLTAREVGAILGLGKSRVYELAASGALPAIRLSPRRILFPAAALDDLERAAVARALEVQSALKEGVQ